MGLKDLLSRWSKREDARVIEREQEAELGDRAEAAQDFEGRKNDVAAASRRAGAAAEDAASGDLD
jgi:hypothetical protein